MTLLLLKRNNLLLVSKMSSIGATIPSRRCLMRDGGKSEREAEDGKCCLDGGWLVAVTVEMRKVCSCILEDTSVMILEDNINQEGYLG